MEEKETMTRQNMNLCTGVLKVFSRNLRVTFCIRGWWFMYEALLKKKKN